MSGLFYLAKADGRVIGKFTEEELRAKISAGDASFMHKAEKRVEAFVEHSSIMVLATHSDDVVREWCNKAVWMHGGEVRAQGDVDVLPRQLKDTASRALSGKLFSKATLTLFTDAFGFDAFERERLVKLWEGSAHVRVLSGPRAIREDQATALGPPQVKTLALHDHHYLGPDGLPQRHRVIHVIEAVVDGVDRLPYRADTNALTIEVGQGFSGLAGDVYQPTAELFVVDMLLAKPLAAGETATLEYSASLHYPAPPPPEFRRIVQSFVENLDIRVEFHPGRLPGDVVWAIWDGMDGPIAESERVTLDSQFAVHRYLRLAEQTTVGFHWDW